MATGCEYGFDGALWHKSAYSGNANNCVECGALSSGRHAVRDTKDRALGVMSFPGAAWQAFVDAVRTDRV